MNRPTCDLCNTQQRSGRPRAYHRIISLLGDHQLCNPCLGLVIDTVGFMVTRRKQIPIKRPRSLARVLPVDVFAMVGADGSLETETDVHRGADVA